MPTKQARYKLVFTLLASGAIAFLIAGVFILPLLAPSAMLLVAAATMYAKWPDQQPEVPTSTDTTMPNTHLDTRSSIDSHDTYIINQFVPTPTNSPIPRPHRPSMEEQEIGRAHSAPDRLELS